MQGEGKEAEDFSEKGSSGVAGDGKGNLSNGRIIESENSNGKQLDGIRVLLAEDYLINQRLLTMMLETHGAMVSVANDGKEAFQKAKLELYDIILMDLNMPNINGIQSSKMIKMFAIETPIVCLTADVNDEILQNILASGMEEIVTKPCQIDELVEVILKYTTIK